MINRKKPQRILFYESIGFVILIVLSWLNELVSLPHLIFGGGEHSSLHEAMLETLALMMVWLVVALFTKRLLRRLYHLEGFLQVCGWCRKIGQDDEWVELETYFAKGFNVKTSHGMCPECQAKYAAECRKHAA
jgi:hypothetical protein